MLSAHPHSDNTIFLCSSVSGDTFHPSGVPRRARAISSSASTHKPHEPTPDSPEWNEFDPPANKSLGAKTWAELEDGSWEDDPRFYKDMVEYHDKVIGRLMDSLDEHGIREDTLVIYLGDNGSPTDVCSMMHHHNEICGGKGKTNDRGTHVPLICSRVSKESLPGFPEPMRLGWILDAIEKDV